MTKLCGVYVVTHLETGMQYVGQSRDIARRWKAHCGRSKSSRLSHAIQKYGVQAFSFRVLELCDLEQIDAREVTWIIELNTVKPHGFNLDAGGNKQKTRTDCTKQKIRERALAYAKDNGRSLSTRKTQGVEVQHDFTHVDGRKVTCSQWELKQFHIEGYDFKTNRMANVTSMAAGRVDVIHGWLLTKREPEIRALKPNLFYHWFEHADGRRIFATPKQMYTLHGADENIVQLLKPQPRQTVCRGWRLSKQKEVA